MFTFNRNYFIIASIILVIEVIIALFLNDKFIRPYFGDVLVVILIYCGIMTFVNCSYWVVATIAILFSFTVETLQYFNIIDKFGLQNNKIAQAVIGTSFSWKDLVCYSTGIIVVIIIEILRSKQKGYA